MKKLIFLSIALLFAMNVAGRVRSVPPVDSGYTVTGVRIVDSVTFVRYSFEKCLLP